MSDFLHDIKAAILAAFREYRRCRHLRFRDGNPDNLPF